MRYAQPHERTAVGERIEPATAEVWFNYAQVLDPYGELELPPEADCVGREWFAADPVERIAVHFYDLPDATLHALEDKRRAADREGWAEIFRVMAIASAVSRLQESPPA